jgi:4-hydroxy-4-methyl-2-oxoglutarate aldolase
MAHVITRFHRPNLSLIQSFAVLGPATVYEAAGRIGSVDPGIKPLAPGIRILGPAFTVVCHPQDNLMLHKALQLAQPGDVLVASAGGHFHAGYWGGLMTTAAMAKGIAGLAIDGCVRDSAEIVQMGFPVFSRGSCMRGTTKGVLGKINHRVLFGEVLVHPGDLVLGDDDGMVVIPQAEIEKVLEAANRRVEAEKIKAEKLRKGVSSVELNKLDPVFASLGLVQE